MTKSFPVLVLLLGLGSSFSYGQVPHQPDPFQSYLTGIKTSQPGGAFVRFAGECGLDISSIRPRFAVGPGSSFTQVNDLSNGLASIDTDFYSTAEVWASGNRTLVELWSNSDDVGSEVRFFDCFVGGKLVEAEVVQWNLPLVEQAGATGWGYSRKWKQIGGRKLRRIEADFVDGRERKIPKPKLDNDGENGLRWIPPLGPLEDWKRPSSILR